MIDVAPALRERSRRCTRHGGDPLTERSGPPAPRRTSARGGLARVVAHRDALEAGGAQNLEDLVEEDHRLGGCGGDVMGGILYSRYVLDPMRVVAWSFHMCVLGTGRTFGI